MKKQPDLVTGAELGRRLGVKHQNIYRLIREGVIKRNKDKLIDFEAARRVIETGRALDKNPAQQSKNGKATPEDLGDMNAARQEYEKYRALTARLEYETRLNEMVPLADVKDFIGAILIATKKNLLNLAAALAPDLVGMENPKEIQAQIDRAIREALENLAKLHNYNG